MKTHHEPHAEEHRCFDGICNTLDKLGIPRNSKWRSLILFMRSIAEYDIYSAEQKRRIQGLVVSVLKERDLTEDRFAELSRQTEEVLSSPWRSRLQAALADLASTVGESRKMLTRRKGDIEQLGQTTVETVQSGKDLDEVLADIRKGFKEVVSFMEADAQNLERLSYTDSLTGLDNRRSFESALERAVAQARATGKPVSLLMADVDLFKRFNDQHGHLIGDQALATVASVIRECQRQAAERGADVFAARFGGEEFAVIVQGMNAAKAQSLAEHIRLRVENYKFLIRDVDGEVLQSGVRLTISLGVASLDPAWKDSLEERLIDAADEALYEAKEGGRNKVAVYAR